MSSHRINAARMLACATPIASANGGHAIVVRSDYFDSALTDVRKELSAHLECGILTRGFR